MRRSMVQKRERRSHLRFDSDKNTVAQIGFDEKFKDCILGLVCNESYSGCSILSLKDTRISSGTKCFIKCGKLSVMEGAVRWISDLDEQAVRIGIEFLSSAS